MLVKSQRGTGSESSTNDPSGKVTFKRQQEPSALRISSLTQRETSQRVLHANYSPREFQIGSLITVLALLLVLHVEIKRT